MENNTLCNRHSLGVNNHTKMYVTYTRIYGWSDYGGESSYQPGYRLENMMWMTLLVYDYIIPGEYIMELKRYITFRNKENNLPMLKEKEKIQWNSDFSSYDKMVDFFNQVFETEYLEEEYVYVMSFNCQMIPQGVFELSHGSADTSIIKMRELAIFLLLSGANKFIVVHNHPNGSKDVSVNDINITRKIQEMANFIEVDFLQHFTIGNDGYDTCIDNEENDEDYIPFN